jgi:hypothetical protein
VSTGTRPVRTHRLPARLAWLLWALAMLGLTTLPWLDHLLRQAGRPDLGLLTTFSLPQRWRA